MLLSLYYIFNLQLNRSLSLLLQNGQGRSKLEFSYGQDTNLVIVPPLEEIFEITNENSHGNSACKKRDAIKFHFFCLNKFYCVLKLNIWQLFCSLKIGASVATALLRS